MNGKTEFVVSPVIDFVVAKRDIADCQIKKVLPIRRFKTCNRDIGFGIKLFCYPTGDRIQLHTIQAAVAHALRHHAKEIADTHRRFKHVAGFESHLLNRLVDRADYGWAGVVCIERRSTRRFVLFLGQRRSQFMILLRPCRFAVIKGFRKTTPADVLREDFLFVRRCLPVFAFQLLEKMNRVHVSAELGL